MGVRQIVRFVLPENIPVEFTARVTNASWGIRDRYLSGSRPRILARIDKRQFPRRVGLYPYRQHKGRKLVLGDRTEALIYILAQELRHMHQQHGYVVHSVFPVGRVKNSRGSFQK
jgi:hypothetical protein